MTAMEGPADPFSTDGVPARWGFVRQLLLGNSKDYYPADLDVAQRALAVAPDAATWAWQERAFLHHIVGYLAHGNATYRRGTTQLIYLGCGLPEPNWRCGDQLHHIARREDPRARVLYADPDATFATYGRALTAEAEVTKIPTRGDDHGTCVETDVLAKVIEAGPDDPAQVLNAPEARAVLDLAQPIDVLLPAAHFLSDPAAVLDRWADALPDGSRIMITHLEQHEDTAEVAQVYRDAFGVCSPRSADEVADLLAGYDLLLDPGVVPLPDWRPPPLPEDPARVPVCRILCAVGQLKRTVRAGLLSDQHLARRYREGESLRTLAQAATSSKETVRRRLHRQGVQMRAKKQPPPSGLSAERLAALYIQGATLKELKGLSGASYGWVRAQLVEQGVELRSRGYKSRPSARSSATGGDQP
ncbi:hypothetical protein DPM19_12130 [Actinomadura craniellae]|uniref:Helix-turn-helix domain-containing protein n=1 Tax=Actinomadura craniellae TaxID=2231787 RepID=A0A365H8T9_9ACTN|nr:SAM-dependent methyltransferase [Actinomadura craniellae]RAY15432.1 hypothetical protein DPM19_12130 [Actinomadura craniellae]